LINNGGEKQAEITIFLAETFISEKQNKQRRRLSCCILVNMVDCYREPDICGPNCGSFSSKIYNWLSS